VRHPGWAEAGAYLLGVKAGCRRAREGYLSEVESFLVVGLSRGFGEAWAGGNGRLMCRCVSCFERIGTHKQLFVSGQRPRAALHVSTSLSCRHCTPPLRPLTW